METRCARGTALTSGLLLLALTVVSTGCKLTQATRDANAARIDAIVEGTTTKDDVVALLGQPTTTVAPATWTYRLAGSPRPSLLVIEFDENLVASVTREDVTTSRRIDPNDESYLD